MIDIQVWVVVLVVVVVGLLPLHLQTVLLLLLLDLLMLQPVQVLQLRPSGLPYIVEYGRCQSNLVGRVQNRVVVKKS